MFPYRDDRPTFTFPFVTSLLIAVCVYVFFREITMSDFARNVMIQRYGLIPAHVTLQSLVTMMFLHGGWSHIIGNMLFLWTFGKSLEDAMGHVKFLGFYLACGVLSGIVHAAVNYGSLVPTVGASGAIAGVMGAYLVTFPRANIKTIFFFVIFVTTVEVPAPMVLLYWFGMQLVSGYGSIVHTTVSDGGVAWFGHIGGFVVGIILVFAMGTRRLYYRPRVY